MSSVAITFAEVDSEDAEKIQSTFTGATTIEEPVQDCLSDCKDTEVLSCFIYSTLSKKVLDMLPDLKLICTRSVGYDHIDLHECARRGITVCNVPDYGSHVIAEHVFALLLGTLRHVFEADTRVAQGTFDYKGLRGMALKGKTIGIIGTGKIGRHVAQIAHGFDMNILAVDMCRVPALEETYGAEYVSYEEALKQSDIITLHVPATDDTHHMINAKAIEQMKDGCIIVNTARGSLIDSQALLQGLESGSIGYALLDVLEHEKNFENNKALIEHPRVTSTPHIAFYADSSMQAMYDTCFQSIESWQTHGKALHTVKPIEKICNLPKVQRHE